MPTCADCSSPFDTPDDHREYLRSIGIETDPIVCPPCRHRQRSALRNERNLYRRTCSACGKAIVTVFSCERNFPVHCPDCWWGDGWDGLTFGREFDFSRPFFDQLRELQDQVPRLCLNNAKHENSEYCNQCVGNKNCYLVFASDDNEDSLYGYWINRCKDTVDCNNTADSVLCFDLVDCEQCYHCILSQDLQNCADCFFSFDLTGCRSCIRCAGLRNKEYWIDNREATPEEYRAELLRMDLGSHRSYESERGKFTATKLSIPHKYAHIRNAEDCTGDYISKCKNCRDCYDVFESEDCRYAYNLVHKHYRNRDVSYVTELRNAYQVTSAIGENFFFCAMTWYGSDLWYSDLLMDCRDCFGCIGLHRKRHCILNTQYSEENYRALVPKIIRHMESTGEWGHFFPPSFSPFCYNETIAHGEFPLSQEKALSLGYRWHERESEHDPSTQPLRATKLPDRIDDVTDDILMQTIECEATKRPFRIIKLELDYYRKMGLPLPRLHPDERHRLRTAMRNPRKLWERTCGKCRKEIATSYAPERSEKVLCEECYLKEVY